MTDQRRTNHRRPFADPSLVGLIRMPESGGSPAVALLRRLIIALGALVAAALIVYFGGDGYIDNNSDTPISLGDAFYYATVSLSTTGYGDIVPGHPDRPGCSPRSSSRRCGCCSSSCSSGPPWSCSPSGPGRPFRIERWRSRVRNHTVVVGYGTKGRAAVETLLGDGAEPDRHRRRRHRPHPARRRVRARAGDRHRQRHPLQRAADRRRAAGRRRSSSPPTATTPRCWSR